MPRCAWAGTDPLSIEYHDQEWGFPSTDDRHLFEKICLEGFQSGLSWMTILRKRENFRRAFRDFAVDRVARFGPRDVERLLGDPGIVRHRGKIESAINNARRARQIIREYGSLARYVWQWSSPHDLSRDLKKRGWTFVGPTTMYAFMQACGVVNDHAPDCPTRPRAELARLLRDLGPRLHQQAYVFCGIDVPGAIAVFDEEEGRTSVVERSLADALSVPYSYVAAWITLTVQSDLNAVGLLAAITARLAAAGISCNVFSALHHDHLFVPFDRRDEAVALLSDVRDPATYG